MIGHEAVFVLLHAGHSQQFFFLFFKQVHIEVVASSSHAAWVSAVSALMRRRQFCILGKVLTTVFYA